MSAKEQVKVAAKLTMILVTFYQCQKVQADTAKIQVLSLMHAIVLLEYSFDVSSLAYVFKTPMEKRFISIGINTSIISNTH